jgi:hypothetical protein
LGTDGKAWGGSDFLEVLIEVPESRNLDEYLKEIDEVGGAR